MNDILLSSIRTDSLEKNYQKVESGQRFTQHKIAKLMP